MSDSIMSEWSVLCKVSRPVVLDRRQVWIFNCGGTIGGGWYNISSESVEVHPKNSGQTVMLLRLARPDLDVHERVVCIKQSAEVTDADRINLAGKIIECGCKSILVFHGTNTIKLTHEHLLANETLVQSVQAKGQRVIIVGSRTPACIVGSDLPWTLGAALAYSEVGEAGVYAVLNGQRFALGEYELKPGGIVEPIS